VQAEREVTQVTPVTQALQETREPQETTEPQVMAVQVEARVIRAMLALLEVLVAAAEAEAAAAVVEGEVPFLLRVLLQQLALREMQLEARVEMAALSVPKPLLVILMVPQAQQEMQVLLALQAQRVTQVLEPLGVVQETPAAREPTV